MLIYLQMLESHEDQEIFIKLYEKYKGLMYHEAFDILHNKEDAEDAVQQSFLYLIYNLDKVKQIDSLKTMSYICIVSRHQAIDYYRKYKQREKIPFDSIENTVWDSVPSDQDKLSDTILKLNPLYRDVLFLFYYHGYSEKEIAGILQLKYDYVRKLLQRARDTLKDLLIVENK